MSELEANNQNNNQRSHVIADPAEKYCIELIREFLSSYGFENTVAALHGECVQQGLPSTVPISSQNVQRIIESFESKNGAKFFRTWNSLIPAGMLQNIDYKKLTFYLHVHFAVLPMRPSPSKTNIAPCNKPKPRDDFYIEINDGVETFVLIKEDNNGIVETEEDDQYGSDGRNTSFTVIDREMSMVSEEGTITETSVDDRLSPPITARQNGSDGMERLRLYLKTAGSELSSEPELLSYFALPLVSNPLAHPSFTELFKESWVTHVTQSLHAFLNAHTISAGINSKPPRLIQLVRSDGRQLNRRFQRLHRDHHHLIGLASELTSALERSVQGQAVDLKVTLDKCARVYPELFVPRSTKPQLFDLDFPKIKMQLLSGSSKNKVLLLQALRWRITRSVPTDRGLILHHYARHDLLGLHDAPPTRLLASLLFPDAALTPHPIQQGVARLVNTLASLRSGRDYLSSNIQLLDVLVPCLMQLKGVTIDNYTSDMLLAALQKLSLRHKLRLGMIGAGLVEWLIGRLGQKTISTYTLEYGCALLMNLCLHEEAKLRCVPLAQQVLKLLARHLGARLPYVNGTLYSLLADKRINAEAKHLGLATVLEHHLKNSDGEMRKQFEYILKLHHTGSTGLVEQHTNDDDDTEEMDLLEEELDASDPIPGDPNGEILLYQQYRLVFPPCPQGVVHRTPSEHPLARPTTPRVHRTTPVLPNTADTITLEPVRENGDPSSPSPALSPAVVQKSPGEPPAAAAKNNGVEEYVCGFMSRPMIPRTPD